MGTGNFGKVNANHYYVVMDEYDCVQEDTKYNITASFNTMEEQSKDGEQPYSWYATDVTGDTSIASTGIGVVYTDVPILDLPLGIRLNVYTKTVNGYYEGFVLDYDVTFEVVNYGEEHSTLEEVLDTLVDNPE